MTEKTSMNPFTEENSCKITLNTYKVVFLSRLELEQWGLVESDDGIGIFGMCVCVRN